MQWADLLVVFSEFRLSVPASLLKWVVYGRDLKFQMIRICFSVVRLSWNWHHTIFWAINIPKLKEWTHWTVKVVCTELRRWWNWKAGSPNCEHCAVFSTMILWKWLTEIIRMSSAPVYPRIFYKFHVPTFSTDSLKNLYFHHIKAESDSYLTICWINCDQWLPDNSRNGK